MKHYDAAVIGFGKAGKTIAGALAAAGRNVAVAERDSSMYGGTCINVACIPTKSLVYSSKLTNTLGGDFKKRSDLYAAAVSEKDELTAMLRNKNYHMLADKENIDVIDGSASFRDSSTLDIKLSSGGTDIITADIIIIDTGARPFIPDIKGLRESKRMYVSETMMSLRELPEDLVIIGGGYIGMEFASMYADFGSNVTIIQDGDVFLPREDRDIADAVEASLASRGIKLLKSTKTLEVQDKDDKTYVIAETAGENITLPADAVLAAAGRRPELSGLRPENAGITLTERGAIQVNEKLETSVPGIYAAGDVTGGLQFTYISLDDQRVLKSQLLGDGTYTTEKRGAVPYSVFIDPAFSRVGLTEQQAADKGFQIKTGMLKAAAVPKAHILRSTQGLMKVITDAKTGYILGAHLFCEESYEMINIIKLAIDNNIPYNVLRDNIYTHPTMSEAFNDLFAAVK